MAKAMGLECLPLEVLEVVVTYLSARDLTHCLVVSRTWYNIFSDDVFWKRHCLFKLYDYFSKSKCLVEPGFKPPAEMVLPTQRSRLQFLQEQHLWKNWDSGRFKEEKIEFDCDDTISYNIKVSFLDNNHVCLHRTYETEVWNVVEIPFLVMTIPYCLKELWEANVYKIIDKDLIVIQCNVVQIYEICLDSKSWSLKHVFLYNKPEEFSSSVTGAESGFDNLLVTESICDESSVDCVVCGEYLVGSYDDEESPHLHVWNLKTGKKVKEDICGICTGAFSTELTTSVKTRKKVLVTFTFKNDPDVEENGRESCSVVYDLSQLQFLLPTHHYHSGIVMYFDGFLSVVHDGSLKLLQHRDITKNETRSDLTTSLPKTVGTVTSIQPVDDNLLVSNRKEVFLINTSGIVTQNQENLCLLKVDFSLSHMEVLFNRYALLHDGYESIKEVWKVGKSLRKVMEFPSDSGTFVARNNACSKIVFERANKLIVLSFW